MDMECSNQRSSEPSCGSPAPAASWELLLEATGDSESADLAAAADGSSAFDADEGDAESCSSGEDRMELDVGRTSKLVSWECWMMETAVAARQVVVLGGEGACPPPSTEDAAASDTESDRLFWEACIAHGY